MLCMCHKNIFVSLEGKIHDAGMLADSGLLQQLQQHAFSTPQHRPSGTYPIHHLQSELLTKDQVACPYE